MNGLSWYWITIELTVTPLVGLLFALPLWLNDQPIFGNLLGTVIMFGSAFALIMREHIQIDVVVRKCIDDGIPCFPHPEAFTRFAVYAFIALFEVILLFMISLRVEQRVRRRGYDPQWR
ncbi:MAG TPA: hypothetical protein VGI12_09325 [Vicinamibacterales bacterium]|jgi:hypothetical protein